MFFKKKTIEQIEANKKKKLEEREAEEKRSHEKYKQQNPFSTGDVVVLKSGGPMMTVEFLRWEEQSTSTSIHDDSTETIRYAVCQWFDNNSNVKGRSPFPIESLKLKLTKNEN